MSAGIAQGPAFVSVTRGGRATGRRFSDRDRAFLARQLVQAMLLWLSCTL